ncbi:MAG: hypothetical protein LBT97_03015 [Planctomycetota bacterium]|jgi:hypothetical protein|nr:hypothetical protein [Planctomycetota bacterium]
MTRDKSQWLKKAAREIGFRSVRMLGTFLSVSRTDEERQMIADVLNEGDNSEVYEWMSDTIDYIAKGIIECLEQHAADEVARGNGAMVTSIVWRRYDGTPGTLPDANCALILHSHGDPDNLLLEAHYDGELWTINITDRDDDRTTILSLPPKVGDIWAYFPTPPTLDA